MSDDMADAQQQDIHAVLKNLKRTDPNSRFVKLSGLGPVTVHSTGSSEKPAPPEKPSANAVYVKERLETMGAQDKALMESCLKDHPGLTPEEFVEMAMMHGF